MSKLMEVTSDLEQNTLISKFTTYILEYRYMYRCWWLVSSDFFAYQKLLVSNYLYVKFKYWLESLSFYLPLKFFQTSSKV